MTSQIDGINFKKSNNSNNSKYDALSNIESYKNKITNKVSNQRNELDKKTNTLNPKEIPKTIN